GKLWAAGLARANLSFLLVILGVLRARGGSFGKLSGPRGMTSAGGIVHSRCSILTRRRLQGRAVRHAAAAWPRSVLVPAPPCRAASKEVSHVPSSSHSGDLVPRRA